MSELIVSRFTSCAWCDAPLVSEDGDEFYCPNDDCAFDLAGPRPRRLGVRFM